MVAEFIALINSRHEDQEFLNGQSLGATMSLKQYASNIDRSLLDAIIYF